MKTVSGFTLVELLAVIIITGILAVTVSVRFTDTDIDLQKAKSDMLAALVFARETAMSRTDGSSAITFVATASTIDVRINNASINSIHQTYPLALPAGVSITAGTGTLSFSTLGETTATTFQLNQGSIADTINVSGVGYAY